MDERIETALKSRPASGVAGLIVGMALGVAVAGDEEAAPPQPTMTRANASAVSLIAPPVREQETAIARGFVPGEGVPKFALAGPTRAMFTIDEASCAPAPGGSMCEVRGRNVGVGNASMIVLAFFEDP